MARAGEVLAGATLTVAEDRQDYGEDRFITIEFLEREMVVLVWTPRGAAHRIITTRKAMKGNADSPPPGLDRDDAPDLSTDGWPAKFVKATVRRGRPRVERPKVSTTIRLSPDVMDYFKAGGRGWQTRIDAALRDWIGKQREGRPRRSDGAA